MTVETTTTGSQVAPAIDMQKVQAFCNDMLVVLNGASTALLLSIGHKTGLFDRMATLPPATSIQIARACGLQERYVREWLNGLVVSRVVVYDPGPQTYRLPAEHAALLTRAAGPDNMAFFATYLPLLGAVEEKVAECFQKGGGVPYSEYPSFQELQAEESGRIFDARLIDAVLPVVDGLPARLQAGIDVADFGCGSGHAINLMARAFPSSRFTGFDFSEEGIAAGRAEARGFGAENAHFVMKDIATLGLGETFDFITAFDSVHDQAKPRKVLKAIFKALRPGGVFLMVDIAASSNVHENVGHPIGPLLYTASVLHCMTVSLAQGGEGLGAMWGEQLARELLTEAGFSDVTVTRIDGDIMNAYYIARKAS